MTSARSWPALAARLRRLEAAGIHAAAAPLADAALRRGLDDADDLAVNLPPVPGHLGPACLGEDGGHGEVTDDSALQR